MSTTLPYEIVADASVPYEESHANGIGSGDAAAALGLSPWESPYSLFCRKIGEIEGPEESEAMRMGKKLEDFIADLFFEEHWDKHPESLGIGSGATVRSVAHPFMLATLDRIFRDDQGHGDLELKTTSIYLKDDWDQYPPDYVSVQVQHQLAVTGLERAWVAVLIGGQHYKDFEIARDDALIANLIEAEQAFWQRVLDKTPPPVDGSDSTIEALRARYDEPDPGSVIELGHHWSAPLLEAREAYEQVIADYEAKLTQVKAQIMEKMGDHEIGTVDGVKDVTWKRSERRSIDTKALRAVEPVIAETFTKTTGVRTLRFVNQKEES
jgi:putative phage-type endonuclease